MKSKRKTDKFRIIFRFLKGNIRFLVGTLVFSVLFTACNALIPQIVKYTADHILVLDGIPDGLNVRQALLLAAILVVAAAVLSGIFNYLSKMCLAKGSENFLKSIRDTLYHHTQYLPFSWHVQHQTGEIIQRCTSDVEVIRNFVCRQLPEVFRICFLIILYLGIMFSMNVPITLAAAAFFPVIIGYSAFFHSRIGKRFQDADEAEGALSSTVQENLTGVRVVRAFGREKYEIDRFDQKNNAYSDLWVYLGKLMSVFWASGDLITNLQVLTVMVLGVVFAVEGRITLGEFIAFLSYNASLTWPVRSLGRIISDMSKAGVSMERVAYILEAEEEDATDANNKPALTGDICFRNVSFAYSLDHPILKNINFTIPAGSTFAILGTTGSGKSTLINLIPRFYDCTSGSVELFGHAVQQYGFAQLRQMIGIVPQRAVLFTGTIRDNMQWACPDATDEQIWQALEIAQAADFVRGKPKGLDEPVETAGRNFSGGQRQRLTIARALVPHPQVLILDDSSSALDFATDAALRKALKEQTHGMTVFIVSQRASAVQRADRILVLDDGNLVGSGTHANLLKTCDVYREICLSQLSREEVEKTL